MKIKSDKQRKAIFANLKGGYFNHLKGVINVKQLAKEMDEPLISFKKNKFAFDGAFRPTVGDIIDDINTGRPQIGIGPGAGIGDYSWSESIFRPTPSDIMADMQRYNQIGIGGDSGIAG